MFIILSTIKQIFTNLYTDIIMIIIITHLSKTLCILPYMNKDLYDFENLTFVAISLRSHD